MAGIYIHIPFCKQACHYCNFHFSTNSKRSDDLIAAIVKEIDFRTHYLPSDAYVDTIYFGGGTPSLLSHRQLELILDKIYEKFTIGDQPEITLEANPDDLTATKLKMFKQAGINRLSIGLQSFLEHELQFMNRAHTAAESSICVQLAQDIGISNISIDLIFGVQKSTLESWEYNLQMALSLQVPHMSCYNLTIEPKTALAHMVRTGKVDDIDMDLSAKQFSLTRQVLGKSNYDHYEISNYAKDGYLSRHNTNYWRSVPYLGIGPSAHSFDGKNRAWNMANNPLYTKAIARGLPTLTIESLTCEDRVNEYIMTGLRTKWGCSLSHLETILKNSSHQVSHSAQKYFEQKLLTRKNDVLLLTEKGKYFADQIASDLFLV